MADPTATPAAETAPPPGAGLISFAAAPADSAPPSAAPTPAANPAGTEASGRPDHVPEQFWDGDKKEVRIVELTKSWTDFRNKISTLPKAPETYELKAPESLAGKVKVDAADPFAKTAMDLAKKHGLSQEAFADLATAFYQREAGAVETNAAQYRAEMAKLDQTLGNDATKVKGQLGPWAFNAFGAEAVPDLERLASTAGGVMLLSKMRDMLGEKSIPGASSSAGGAVTLESLRALQASKEYLRGDPEIRRKVEEGYKQLYPQASA